jgi:hypothetical protein
LSHQRDNKIEEQNYVFDSQSKTMCYAGSQSKKMIVDLNVGQISSGVDETVGERDVVQSEDVDDEMSEVDCRKRAGEKDVSTDSAIQVWKIIYFALKIFQNKIPFDFSPGE